MTDTISKHERNLSAIIHASTFSKFFIPFGNFLLPLVLWTANKKEHEFVDYNGKQALNFQISILLYSIVLGILSVPFLLGFLPEIFDHGHFGLGNLNTFNNFNIDLDFDDIGFGAWIFPLGIAGLGTRRIVHYKCGVHDIGNYKDERGAIIYLPHHYKIHQIRKAYAVGD